MSTKEEIIIHALKIFANKGYENTNLDEIAKEVGITKPAIYYHFKNKKELYNEIFRKKFENLSFEKQNSLEEDIKHYIYTMGSFFLNNPYIAKLFAKELANEALHLEDDTLKIISKTLKFLTAVLQNTQINPIFVQTLVISSLTTYTNTLNLRKRIQGIVENTKEEFDITEEVYKTILNYVKVSS